MKLFLFDCGQDQFSPPECEPDDLPGIVARNHDQVMQKLRYSAEFGDVQGTRSDCLYALRRSARIALERALGQASGEPEYEHAAHAKAHRCWRVSCEARSKGGFCNSLDRLSCTASQALLVMGFGACLCFGDLRTSSRSSQSRPSQSRLHRQSEPVGDFWDVHSASETL